ncbi:MAG TPA: hypothetical protein VNB06_21125 [Thermoanaerobaculia bacterium]|nr:hypothetical protein [Thermoanaerobaculia bacterium]
MPKNSLGYTILVSLALSAVLGFATPERSQGTAIPRMPDGKPDLSGTYDSATLTPLNRPAEYGDKLYMTVEEAEAIAQAEREILARANAQSAVDREAPPVGGAPPTGADDSEREALGAGNVGGYNAFWIDRGNEAFTVDGKFRTSIVYDPPNGRQPRMTPRGMQKVADNFSSFTRPNDGTAWWLDGDAPGPFDGPEDLALAERCLLGFSAGPPMLPGLYNNHKRIVQTKDHVMILMEMVHDVRVIRLDSEHAPDYERRWLGDSIGWWEGDTLVVQTKNFREDTGLYGGDENLHLIERFTRQPDGNLLYNFTVTDPTAWTAPWSGEYPWRASEDRVYEYACHEGNYAMGNILRGARLLEEEARQATP